MTVPTLKLNHPAGTIMLSAGQRLTFGRTRVDEQQTAATAPHLGLSKSGRLHQHAGAVTVDDSGWVLANTGRWLHLVILADSGDRNDLAPGRILRVPYRRCRVEVLTGDEAVGFDAECSHVADATDLISLDAGDTVQGLGLDRSTGYFRALVALCEPRLRDASTDDVASVNQIVRTLNSSAAETERVSVKAVERRLAHVRRRLGLGGDPLGISAAGLEQRNAGHHLADLLVRTGTVTTADLVLIAPAVVATDEPSP